MPHVFSINYKYMRGRPIAPSPLWGGRPAGQGGGGKGR